MNNKSISIVTVVYNSELYIENTIKSIIDQNYDKIEYIIIDGGSDDNTLNIIDKYKQQISKVISEKDNGLYDAMNKGLKEASNEYILFINAGDKLADNYVIEKIMNIADNSDVVYGETLIIDKSWNIVHHRRLKTPENLNWKHFKGGMRVSHQSFIAKRAICPKYKLKYKYTADFEWCLNILKHSEKITNSNLVISHFMEGGQTSKTIIPGLKERFKIMVRYYGFVNALFSNIILGVKFTFFVLVHRWF